MATVEELKTRLYAALQHSPGCSCGKCSGGLNVVDQLCARLAAAERERDEALHAEDVAERYREAAETRVAALTTASGRVRSADRSRGISVLTQEAEIALAALYDVLNDEAHGCG